MIGSPRLVVTSGDAVDNTTLHAQCRTGGSAGLRRSGIPANRADLSDHDCLTGWRPGRRPTWLLKNERGEFEPQEIPSRHELTDGDALLNACLAGAGLAHLPTWLADDALRTGAFSGQYLAEHMRISDGAQRVRSPASGRACVKTQK